MKDEKNWKRLFFNYLTTITKWEVLTGYLKVRKNIRTNSLILGISKEILRSIDYSAIISIYDGVPSINIVCPSIKVDTVNANES